MGAAGEPVVFIGFGSQVTEPDLWKTLLRGALQMGSRVILGPGSSNSGAIPSDEQVHVVEYVPYRWLFPRVAVVAHHCGAGTAGEALRAGARSVLVPFTGEQRFWAARLFDAGVAPPPLNPRTLTADQFAHALRSVLQSQVWASRSTAVRRRIAAEDGVGTAVRLIERYAIRREVDGGRGQAPPGE